MRRRADKPQQHRHARIPRKPAKRRPPEWCAHEPSERRATSGSAGLARTFPFLLSFPHGSRLMRLSQAKFSLVFAEATDHEITSGGEAQARGLTPEILEELLRD